MTRSSDQAHGGPIWSSPPPATARGRLLLLSFHFPPGQAAGALRWQKFAGVFAEAGWELDVVTADPAGLPQGADPSRMSDLPPGVRVFAAAAPRPVVERVEHALWRARRTIGRAVAARAEQAATPAAGGGASGPRPSESLSRSQSLARVGLNRAMLRRAFLALTQYARDRAWSGAALAAARRARAGQPYAAVISCGPPHMAHVAGRRLARELRVPFVMDLRDPWSLVERVPEDLGSPLWYFLARRHERQCVRAAALVVMNSDPARDAMREEYPDAAGRIIGVMNGWDEPPPGPPPADRPFTIAYGGSVYLDRDPETLFAAVAALVAERSLTPGLLRVLFVGGGQASLRDIADRFGIGAFLQLVPPLPWREAMNLLSEAHVLVSLAQDSHLAIPSKLFDYMALPGAVLAFADPSSATARMLAGTGAAVVPPRDRVTAAAHLRRWWDDYRTGSDRRAAPPAHLSRRAQAGVLLSALDAVLDRRGVGPHAPHAALAAGRA